MMGMVLLFSRRLIVTAYPSLFGYGDIRVLERASVYGIVIWKPHYSMSYD